jgi:hypothetical protein
MSAAIAMDSHPIRDQIHRDCLSIENAAHDAGDMSNRNVIRVRNSFLGVVGQSLSSR